MLDSRKIFVRREKFSPAIPTDDAPFRAAGEVTLLLVYIYMNVCLSRYRTPLLMVGLSILIDST